jgi:tRNA threonylcarbamoyladenosine biosynthesis protein TsaE
LEHSYSVQVTSRSPENTQSVGRILGEHARPGDVFLLVGELGAGKTCLTQGVLWGLGLDEYARSPTFVLVSQYNGRLTLYHMDLYRLDTFDEIADLGLDEYLLGDGLSVVEWAEKAPEIFPEQHLMIQIEYLDETTRRLTLASSDEHHAETMDAVKASMAKK